jgi:hypothetical protein
VTSGAAPSGSASVCVMGGLSSPGAAGMIYAPDDAENR